MIPRTQPARSQTAGRPPVSPIRVLGAVRLAIVGAFAIYLLISRPPGYTAILLTLLGAFVVLPYTIQAILRSRLRKRQNG